VLPRTIFESKLSQSRLDVNLEFVYDMFFDN
jgi:hypothetical protein